MTISDFVAYVKQTWKNKPDTSSPISAERLNYLESGIKGNSDAIEKIAAAVISNIINDSNKIASMAALYSANTNLQSQITSLNSDLVATKADFFEVSTLLENTLMQTIDFPSGLSRPPFLVAAQINLFEGVWVNLAEITGFTNFACNNYQIAINKDAAENYVGYGARFLLKK